MKRKGPSQKGVLREPLLAIVLIVLLLLRPKEEEIIVDVELRTTIKKNLPTVKTSVRFGINESKN